MSAADVFADDRQLAHELAAVARDLLLAVRAEMAADGVAPEDWGPAGDRRANVLLLEGLAAARPDDAVLSEESADDPVRLAAERVWIIDPLDGTREFATPGRTDWAVHVALTVGGVPVVGAVSLPDGRVLDGSVPAPAVDPARPPRLVLSRTRRPPLCLAVAERLGLEVVELGSAGAKVASIIDGHNDVYLHVGGMRQWDSCAPVAAALGCGLHASRVDGGPLRYNGADVNLPDLLVCRPEWAEKVLAAVAELS